MADKRTTPEAPESPSAGQGPRRNKRVPPTIDLIAQEVKPAPPDPPAQEPDPPPHAAGEQSKPDPMPEFVSNADATGGNSDTARPEAKTKLSEAALAGGIAGATITIVLIAALWVSGLMPTRNGGTVIMTDNKTIDTLSERLAKVEQAIAKLPPGEPAVAERLAAADNAMRSLGVALTALNKRSDDASANAADARKNAEEAAKAVTELRASIQEVVKNTSAGTAPADLDGLQKRIAALENSAKSARDEIAKTSSADNAARLALSAAALRDAVLRGVPFASELGEVKSLGADDKALAPLTPFADSGVPGDQALVHELAGLIPAMLKASGAQAPSGGFLERLQANVSRLVRIRPVDAPPGDDASAVLARIEIAAAKADVAAALADLAKLSDVVRTPAKDWIEKAKARQAAREAARNFAADAARALGPRAGAQ